MTSSCRAGGQGVVEPGGRHRPARRGGIVGGRGGRRGTRRRRTDSVCCTDLSRPRGRGYLRPRGCRRRRAPSSGAPRRPVHAVATVVGGVVVVGGRRGEEARLEVVGRRRGVVQAAAAVRVRPTVGVVQRRRPLGRDVQRVLRGARGPVRVQGMVGDDLQGDCRVVHA